MKKVIVYILIGILAVLCIFTAWKAYTVKEKVEYVTIQDTIKICDTITNWVPYDVYHYRTDTAYLPIIDEKFDTILKIDSILVQVPISIYKYDSVIRYSTHVTHVAATVSGFDVNMEELSVDTKIMPQEAKKPWYHNIVPAVGVGYGTSGFGIFAGVGYKLN